MIYDGNSTIEDLEIINPNLPPKLEGLKDTYLDVKAQLNPELHRAFEIANQANLTLDELEDLDRREMFIYDQQGAVALGREQEKRAIAENLLTLLDDEAIAATTGLSLETIRELREETS